MTVSFSPEEQALMAAAASLEDKIDTVEAMNDDLKGQARIIAGMLAEAVEREHRLRAEIADLRAQLAAAAPA